MAKQTKQTAIDLLLIEFVSEEQNESFEFLTHGDKRKVFNHFLFLLRNKFLTDLEFKEFVSQMTNEYFLINL